jgi:glucose-1-phosphate cytidylyltransferase
MKVVLLAGGLGTRLSEETDIRPKPMVEIGGKPIIWHIMKLYSHYGFNEFVVCLGYKGYVIKEFFANLFLHLSDVTIDISNNEIKVHNSPVDKWKITLVETGSHTMTGGRIKRIKEYTDNKRFMLTYGDGVSNVNIEELLSFHEEKRKMCTVTAVQPSGRFGVLQINEDNEVESFHEKRAEDSGWINGGFFVCEPGIFDFIKDDDTIWERDPLEAIARQNQLASYKHKGFWKPMDSLKDKMDLNELWNKNQADWKVWQ